MSTQELLSVLEATHAECISQCVKSRQEEIHQALVDRTNAISSTQLQDFDWQMKVIAAMCTTHKDSQTR